MADDRLVRMRYSSIVKGIRRGRLWKKWTNVLSELIRARSVSDEDARRMVFDCI